MIKVSVLYPNGPGATFDIAYYTRSHMPMVGRLLGEALKRMEIDEGLGGPTPGSSALRKALARRRAAPRAARQSGRH